MTKLLVTGGAGFIGSNFIRYMLQKHPEYEVTNVDKLTYAGNLENLKDIENSHQYDFIKGDIADRELVDKIFHQGFDVVVNFAAESHVDRSILDSSPFISTNVQGVQVLLEGIKQKGIKLFIQVTTDEVYGSLGVTGKFTEESPLLPNNPYAASKAAADCLCRAYYHTYGLPIIITRCSNNYGPFQFPEKFIPLVTTNTMEGNEIPVYGDGLNIRDWIHVIDHCRALDLVIQQGKPGEIYNIGGNSEKANLEVVHHIMDIMGKPRSLITFVTDRLGHDRRYALDTTKINLELGWEPTIPFADGLKDTIKWYTDNQSWWRKIKSGEYARYYQRMYSQR
ncbi:dTDP-glucose 4,6-dehydratase [Chloroflexota bacterium]